MGELPRGFTAAQQLGLLEAALKLTQDNVVVTTADLEAPGPTMVERTSSAGRQADEATQREGARLQDHFKTALDGSLDGVVLLESVFDEEDRVTDFRCLFANALTLGALGRRAEDVIGTRASAIVPAAVGTRVWQLLVEVAGTREARRETVSHGATRETQRWYQLQMVPLQKGVAVTFRDVTMARKVDEQLQQAQKMESVGRLAAGIAHDFNNALSAILGFGRLLVEDIPLGQADLRDAMELVRSAERASELTQHLLAFSRQQHLNPVVLNPNTSLADMVRMLERLVGEDVRIRMVLDPTVGRVRVDRGQLEQVVMNLVVNARDAMPTGGMILIETANVTLTPAYAELYPPCQPGPYVCISVTDTGHGIPREIQDKIIEPFFTTKPPGQGTGLGLATVYGIVRQSGGYLWLNSEVGRGTTFKICLPRTDQDATAVGTAHVVSEMGAGETILVVDDDPSVRHYVMRLLARHGYQVREAAAAEEALAILSDQRHPVQAVITDIVMPTMSGPQLLAEARKLRGNLPAVYMSGYVEATVVDRGLLEAGSAFLAKPLVAGALLAKVREALAA